MKKQVCLGILLYALVAAVSFFILAGRPFLSLLSGPVSAEGQLGWGELEGQYLTYSVTHPVVSFVEEYYSGDSSRVRKMAYVTYDKERQAFLKIVVSERNKNGFDRLLRAMNRSQELKASWGEQQASEERPVEVEGSLMLMTDQDELGQVEDALTGSDFEGTDELRSLALSQTEWYVLKDGAVGGISMGYLWISAAAICLNILILLICLISLTKRGKAAGMGSSGDVVEQFLNQQRVWLEPWSAKVGTRQTMIGFLSLIGVAAALVVLGFAVGAPVMEVLTCHLPLGVCIGELCGVPLMMGAGLALHPDKILKRCKKNLEKQLPDKNEREAAVRELLETDQQWAVLEKGKEDVKYGILGERYWMFLTGKGIAVAVDSQKVEKIESERISGQIRSGMVRMHYTYYTIQIDYQNHGKKKGYDAVINFDAKDSAGHFMMLARMRLGDRAEAVIH